MKKLKHIILAIIIIFNCLILSGLFFIFILINKDDDKTKGIKFAVQNEYQTKAGEGTKYEIIDGKLYGCGWNDWGQLGTGTVENIDVVYEEPILIADSVVHVDTCNNGTTVFLNDKGELYGIGNISADNWEFQLVRQKDTTEKKDLLRHRHGLQIM